MTRFNTQTEALCYLSSTAKDSGDIRTLEEIRDTSALAIDGNSFIAGSAYDKTQTMFLEQLPFDVGANVLIGSFTCRVLHIYPEATEHLSPRFKLEPDEMNATIIFGRLNYRRGFEDEILAARQVAYSFRDGAGQFLDSYFEHVSMLPAHEIFNLNNSVMGGFAIRQSRLNIPNVQDAEMAVAHQVIQTHPFLEIMGTELGLTSTMLPNLADWIAAGQNNE
ncbi:MAG TPA: hypothetical protein VFT59_04435 [Candidatus Saccharimonadales bacterium]|nr:hypothetical protein [Candidatus Saccharimonadales bacterium]